MESIISSWINSKRFFLNKIYFQLNTSLRFHNLKKGQDKTESFLALLKSKKMLIITIILYMNWLVSYCEMINLKNCFLHGINLHLIKWINLKIKRIAGNFIFYGVALKSNNLGVNPYLTYTISAIVELVGYIISHNLVDRLGRKITYGCLLLGGGLSCLSIVFLSNFNDH